MKMGKDLSSRMQTEIAKESNILATKTIGGSWKECEFGAVHLLNLRSLPLGGFFFFFL